MKMTQLMRTLLLYYGGFRGEIIKDRKLVCELHSSENISQPKSHEKSRTCCSSDVLYRQLFRLIDGTAMQEHHPMAAYRRSCKAKASRDDSEPGDASWRDRYWRLEAIGWPSIAIEATKEREEQLNSLSKSLTTAVEESDEQSGSPLASRRGSYVRPPPSPSEQRRVLLALSAADHQVPTTNQSSPFMSPSNQSSPLDTRSETVLMKRHGPLSLQTPFSRAAALAAERMDEIDDIQLCSGLSPHMHRCGLSGTEVEKQGKEACLTVEVEAISSSPCARSSPSDIMSRSLSRQGSSSTSAAADKWKCRAVPIA